MVYRANCVIRYKLRAIEMRGSEFIDRLRKLAAQRGIECTYDPDRGKGSHGRIRFGQRISVIPDLRRELKKGTLSSICRDLAIKPQDLYEV